jgi:hypothetical protein
VLRPFVPSFGAVLFLALFVWLFAAGANGWSALLADGDTGWHIRNGEMILHCGCVPREDWFSFGTQGHAWFAWEWLADVLFAFLHRMAGLKAVVFFSGIVIAAAQYIVFRHALWRGASPLIALALVFAATNASTVHFLARPHIFTLLLFAATAWLLDRDRHHPTRAVWLLPPAIALWTNLHGGFIAAFTLLGARVAECAVIREPRAGLRRMLAVTAASAASTLANPYGWRLYVHLWSYLQSGWIRDWVEEFQSPRFRSESMFWFEILLALGIATLPRLLASYRIRDAIVIAAWAHAALASVRHVPLYAIASAPVIAAELDRVLSGAAKDSRSAFAIVREIGREWSSAAPKVSLLPLAVLSAIFVFTPDSSWPADFPARLFPSSMVTRNLQALSANPPVHVFSTDQWSDYLIYRLHPKVQTWFDGRSDFFADWRGEDYRALMQGQPGCVRILDREHVRFALVPAKWPLSAMLQANPAWQVRDRDSGRILFQRR